MWRDALYLARKDTEYLFRSRLVWFWAFLMPVIFFYFIGTVTGGFSRPAVAPAIALAAPPTSGFMADLLADRLAKQGYRVVRVGSEAESARYMRRLSVPEGFTENVLSGKPMKVTFARTGGGLNASYDQFRAGRAVYSVLADLIAVTGTGGQASRETLAAMSARPRTLTVEVSQAGRRVRPPTGFEQSVPGTMVMFVLLAMFTSGGVWLVVEREQGILRRLASSPMSRGAIVAGKWGARMSLAIVQIAFAMLSGALLFRVHWGPNLWMIALVLVAYGALAVSLGVLVGTLAKTQGQAIAIGVLASNVMGALGGCWWPIEITPRWVQSIALLFPTGWTMDALHKLVSFGDPASAALPHLVVLTVAALVAGYFSARRFRFQ
jgi:ABC-2 type transport system permease protein